MLRESHRPGIEHATCKSQVLRLSGEPPRNRNDNVVNSFFFDRRILSETLIFGSSDRGHVRHIIYTEQCKKQAAVKVPLGNWPQLNQGVKHLVKYLKW